MYLKNGDNVQAGESGERQGGEGSAQGLSWSLIHSQTFPLRWKWLFFFFFCINQLKWVYPPLEMKLHFHFHTTHFPWGQEALPELEEVGSGRCRSPWHESTSVNSTPISPNLGNHSEQSHSPISTATRTCQRLTCHQKAETRRKDTATNAFF